jgi:signal peptidase II
MTGSILSDRTPPLRNWFLGFLTALFVFSIDRLTKAIVMKYLLYGKPYEFIDGIVRWTYIRNPNALFGISLGNGFPYEILTVILTVVLIFLIIREKKTLWTLTYGLLLGGAMGNGFDRIKMGEVVDFIDVGISERLRWPIFNIADSAVSIGIVLIIFLSLVEKWRERG